MGRHSRQLSILALAVLALATVLAACGGPIAGGGLPGIPATGVFIDSPVEGLSYVSGGHSGITGAGGLFTYEIGHDATFSVGKIVLGTGTGQPIMTPVSLVPGASNENNRAVANMARFLLALDDDADPDNGILLIEDVRDFASGSVDFDVNAAEFIANNGALVGALTSTTSAGLRNLAEVTGAQAHLRDSLLASMAGSYEATLGGDDSGTMTMDIALNGDLSGTGTFDGIAGGTPFALFGTVESNRNAAFSASGGITFDGTVASNGVFDGTWERTSGEKGTFHATRTAG